LGINLQETVLARMAEIENKENNDPQARLGISNESVTPKHVTHCTLKHLHMAESSYDQLPSWSPEIQKEFDGDFVRCIVANGWAFHCSDNPQTKIFLEKWSRGPPASNHKKLSGAVLDSELGKAEEWVRQKIQGKVGTGQCDGWKNKAKKSVVSTMLMVKNEVRIVFSQAEMKFC
jgi:hypothetical protein